FNGALGNQVPADAHIVGAYLYWEAIYAPGVKPTKGVKFRNFKIDPDADVPTTGFPNTPVIGLKANTIAPIPGNTASCWGSAVSATANLTMFRFDVKHLLPKQYDSRGVWTGRLLVN